MENSININNDNNLDENLEIEENINNPNSIEDQLNYYKNEYLKYKSKYEYIVKENNKLIKERNKLLFKIGILKKELKEGNLPKNNIKKRNSKAPKKANLEDNNNIIIDTNKNEEEIFDIEKEIEKLNKNNFHKNNGINQSIFQTLKEETDEHNKILDELNNDNNQELEEKVLLTLESMNFDDEEENSIKNQSEKNLNSKIKVARRSNKIIQPKKSFSKESFSKEAKIKQILDQKNLIINSILTAPSQNTSNNKDPQNTMSAKSNADTDIKFDENIIKESLSNEFIHYEKDSINFRKLLSLKEKKIYTLYTLLKRWEHYSKILKKGIENFYKALEAFSNNLLHVENDTFNESPDLLGLIYLLQHSLGEVMAHCKSFLTTIDSMFILQIENSKQKFQNIRAQRYNLVLKIAELLNVQNKFLSTKKNSYNSNGFKAAKDNYYKKLNTIEICKFEYFCNLNQLLMMTQIEVPQIICLLTFSLMVFFRQVHNIMKETDGPIKDNLEKINARVATKNKIIENMKLEKKELETKLFNKKEVDKNLTKKEGFVNIRENENNSNFKRIYIRMNEGSLIYFKTKKQNLNLKEEDSKSKIYLNMIERIDIKNYNDLCNLLLSNVKKNEKKYEYPFCFEITDASTSKTFLLQAYTEYETEEWISAVQNAISDRISNFHEIKDIDLDGKNTGKKNIVDNIKEENDDDINNKKIDDIINNNICADCGAKNPTWLCLNWLSIICIDCSAIHRSLGANISKVKGFRLDNISNDIIELLENIKQSEINEILEKNLKDDEKPKPESKYNIKEQFIIEKYKNKKYIDNNNLDMNNENIGTILIKIIEDNNLLDIYRYIKNDYDITNKIIIDNGEEYELLHYCAFKGKIQIIKLLYALGVDINKEDNKGLKPIIYAKLNKKTEVIEYLSKKEKI